MIHCPRIVCDGRFIQVITLVTFFILVGCDRTTTDPAETSSTESTSENPRSVTSRETDDLQEAANALSKGQINAAEKNVTKHLMKSPDDSRGLELAGDIASAKSDTSTAIAFYESALKKSDVGGLDLFNKLGRQQMNLGDPYGAIETLGRAIAVHPDDPQIRTNYSGLLAAMGLTRDATEHCRWLLRRRRGGLSDLILLADPSAPRADIASCQYSLKHRPNDRRPLYPLALVDVFEGNWDQAKERLQDVTKSHADFAPAWALLGRVLVETGNEGAVLQWRQDAPAASQDWAPYWVAAGLWSEQHGDFEMAASAFRRALQINETHGEALTHLAVNLAQMGRDEDAKRVSERSAVVNALADSLESLFSWHKNSQRSALEIADAMKQLGRYWEAEAWARVSLGMTQQIDTDARAKHKQYFDLLTSQTPWVDPTATLNQIAKVDSFPKYRWSDESEQNDSQNSDTQSVGAMGPVSVRFADQAADRGLNHQCTISQTTEKSIAIYHSTAGGVGVIDFDLDGWQDLYLTVIDGDPGRENSSPNLMYRNQSGQFVSIDRSIGTDDPGFSQGVAVGDFNADGFPDLFVANIGRNRLYRNNGDGSFSEVAGEVGLGGANWTSSVAIADLNGDSLADLFEVQYCAGQEVYRQPCIDNELREARSCSPLVFPAESDRVWQGMPDGNYQEVTTSWLQDQNPGHGLGLVVGKIDDQPGLDVYVANDMTANHFWSANANVAEHQFSDQAAVRGLAVNRRSQSQASMGMAIGDADLDGDMDLYLTHFTDEYNTFYEQVSPGVWFDQTSSVGLATPTQRMLAFGTEWIDANNDGWLELVVANGHVDDFSHQGDSLRMKPQLFSRQPNGEWKMVAPEVSGPYFAQDLVGRALATCDFDRDGNQDVVITHLFDPVALLVNETSDSGNSIRIRLKGTRCDRDAIGAIFRTKVGNKTRELQLTAGDGFQCSNERVLHLGLGSHGITGSVTVVWPDGSEQQFSALNAGGDYLLVQGQGQVFAL